MDIRVYTCGDSSKTATGILERRDIISKPNFITELIYFQRKSPHLRRLDAIASGILLIFLPFKPE